MAKDGTFYVAWKEGEDIRVAFYTKADAQKCVWSWYIEWLQSANDKDLPLPRIKSDVLDSWEELITNNSIDGIGFIEDADVYEDFEAFKEGAKNG